METKINKPVSFILSTGRTGTQFFSRYLTESCKGILCKHEPFPSWHFKWYSNFYQQGKLSGSFVAKQYVSQRRSVLRNQNIKHYVESSNLLFGCVNAINEKIEKAGVVHIIRNPLDYTISHLNFGFWTGIKGFTAKNIPGWIEAIDKDIKKSNDPVLILLARWIYVNKVIASYKHNNPYLLLRFEDIFGRSAINPVAELQKTRNFFGCEEISFEEQQAWLKRTANKSRKNLLKRWPIKEYHLDFIREDGKDLLQEFDYVIKDQNSVSK